MTDLNELYKKAQQEQAKPKYKFGGISYLHTVTKKQPRLSDGKRGRPPVRIVIPANMKATKK